MRILGRVNASEHLKRARIEALRAQGYTVDARLGVARKPAALDGAGIRLQRDFSVVSEGNSLLERPKQARELLGWK